MPHHHSADVLLDIIDIVDIIDIADRMDIIDVVIDIPTYRAEHHGAGVLDGKACGEPVHGVVVDTCRYCIVDIT